MPFYIWNSGKKFSVGNLFRYSDTNQFLTLVGSYKDVFVEQLGFFSVTNLGSFSIQANSFQPLYDVSNLNEEDSDLLKEKVSELLRLGYLEHSNSNWSSPVWPKRFEDAPNELDICVDYSSLNQITETFYKLPSIAAILKSISRSGVFSKLVLKDAFHQIGLDENSKRMTAFDTNFGKFQFTTFHRGMKNAHTTLQYTMETVLKKIENILIYQGQVMVFSNSFKHHLSTLKKVFSAFRLFNLKIDVNESLFMTSRLVYLGRDIRESGIGMPRNKKRQIALFPIPRNKRELQSFLGLTSQFREYVHNFSELARPLYALTSQNRPFFWTRETKEDFEELKNRLVYAKPIALQ